VTPTFLSALAFAARKHRNQRRKDIEGTPYLNHVIEVVEALVRDGGVTDEAMLVAALLHDTVEDTDTTFEEIEAAFGGDVAALVREMTDDKSLPKLERKRLQVEHAPHASRRAKQLKVADKICNIRDVAASPPSHWPLDRRRNYLDWAERVVVGCRGVNAHLDAAFDEALARARATLVSE